jgi:hypothetical protein
MAYPNRIALKLTIVLISILAFVTRETIANYPIHVSITNNLNPTSTPLTVHCKSKDDDLGFHTLAHGGKYTFTFRKSAFPFFKSTLFFCGFTWPESRYRHYLDIYVQKHMDCTQCDWYINNTGGCYWESATVGTLCFPWKSIELNQLMDANSTSKM